MNTYFTGGDARVRVVLNDTDVTGLKPGEPLLFIAVSYTHLDVYKRQRQHFRRV